MSIALSSKSSKMTEEIAASPAARRRSRWPSALRWIPTSTDHIIAAEKRLLSLVRTPYKQERVSIGSGPPGSKIRWFRSTSNETRFINTVTFDGKEDSPTLVMVHGYGASQGFFFRNFDALAKHFKVIAIDQLGWGGSSRPDFTCKSTEETEAWFIDSFEEWRKAKNLTKFILLGHSFGGYVAAKYAIKHPEHVQHLILVGPAGFTSETEHKSEWLTRFRATWKGAIVNHLWESNFTPQKLVRYCAISTEPLAYAFRPRPISTFLTFPIQKTSFSCIVAYMLINAANLLYYTVCCLCYFDGFQMKHARFFFWILGFTLVNYRRGLGPWGPDMVRKYTSARFGNPESGEVLNEDESRLLTDYVYHTLAAKASGELCLKYIFAFGAFARKPLLHCASEWKVPTTFIYGVQDWMDYQGAQEARKSMKVPCDIYRVPQAGHFVFIDNTAAFHSTVVHACRRFISPEQESFSLPEGVRSV